MVSINGESSLGAARSCLCPATLGQVCLLGWVVAGEPVRMQYQVLGRQGTVPTRAQVKVQQSSATALAPGPD